MWTRIVAAKAYSHIDAGFSVGKGDMPWSLRDFQQDVVVFRWRGRRHCLLIPASKTIMRNCMAALVE